MNDVSCWESRSMDCSWSHKNWKKKRPSEDRDGQDCSVRWRRELLLLHSPLKTRLLPDGGAKHRTNITELHWPGSWLRIYGVNSPLVTLKCSTALFLSPSVRTWTFQLLNGSQNDVGNMMVCNPDTTKVRMQSFWNKLCLLTCFTCEMFCGLIETVHHQRQEVQRTVVVWTWWKYIHTVVVRVGGRETISSSPGNKNTSC